jgi:hypothetical protein
LSQKRQIFAKFFCENILKIITMVPAGREPKVEIGELGARPVHREPDAGQLSLSAGQPEIGKKSQADQCWTPGKNELANCSSET